MEDYKEKYEQALERAKKFYNGELYAECNGSLVEYIFPELEGSEDERIRKEIISYLRGCYGAGSEDYLISKRKEWIAWLEKQGEQKSADKLEPKIKVKYAGCEYIVLEVKDIAGVTYYGIEDEPNHIDYVKADNCEIISGGYGIKENGSPYPTKPAVFSEQKPAWSEEDETIYKDCIECVNRCAMSSAQVHGIVSWLKSLKERYTWKPSEEMLEALYKAVPDNVKEMSEDEMLLDKLYQGLKYGRVLSEN